MLQLGKCYDNGRGVEEDYKKATQWFEKAAEKGNAQAMLQLGECYDIGRGVEKDYKKAIVLYSMAADKRYTWAIEELEHAKNGDNEELKNAYVWFSNLSDEEKDDALKKIFHK